MGLVKRQILTFLVIVIFIGSLHATDYPEPGSCETDNDCLIGQAKCLRRECHCTGEYDFGDGKTNCEKWEKCTGKQDPCKNDSDPTTSNSHCVQSKNGFTACKCDDGHFGRYKRPRCFTSKALKYIMISGRQDRCLADKNCPSYSRCLKDKLCTCKDEFHGNGEKCKKYPPKDCKAVEDCPAHKKNQKAKCGIDGKCRCVDMYAGNGDYCRKAKPCPKQCGSNEFCMIDPLLPKDHKCECKVGFVKDKDGGKCVGE
ncbi:uncharacterized protein LOC144657748 [Oculina patagonica]